MTPKFIKINDIRIKLSNIKEYGTYFEDEIDAMLSRDAKSGRFLYIVTYQNENIDFSQYDIDIDFYLTLMDKLLCVVY